MAGKVIEGIKLIRHNAAGVNNPDDPSFPFRLTLKCRPPEFMEMAFIGICGPQEIVVVRGMTREALDEFVKVNRFDTHPRLQSLVIEEPEKNPPPPPPPPPPVERWNFYRGDMLGQKDCNDCR